MQLDTSVHINVFSIILISAYLNQLTSNIYQMKSIYFLLFNLLLLVLPKIIWAQISIANTTPVVENFDAMGSSATASLPANWKMSPVATASPLWSNATNFTATTIAVN